MSSILKVDQLQDSGGNEIITSNGSGTITVNNQTFKNGITEADMWRLTAQKTDNTDITANLERVDSLGFGYVGTGMTESSGIFSFPSTGIYLIKFLAKINIVTNDNVSTRINVTTDNSNYTMVSEMGGSGDASSVGVTSVYSEYIFDVTNISTHKVKFSMESLASGSSLTGLTDVNYTTFTFIRLGDT